MGGNPPLYDVRQCLCFDTFNLHCPQPFNGWIQSALVLNCADWSCMERMMNGETIRMKSRRPPLLIAINKRMWLSMTKCVESLNDRHTPPMMTMTLDLPCPTPTFFIQLFNATLGRKTPLNFSGCATTAQCALFLLPPPSSFFALLPAQVLTE